VWDENDREQVITLTSDEGGERLDVFLARSLEGMTRSRIQKLIRDKRVQVNCSFQRQSCVLNRGDLVEVSLPPPQETGIVAEHLPLDIIYEDSNILVINKPRGMVVHPAPGHLRGTLVNALLHYCNDLSGIGGELRPGIVHRLDKDTSGVLVVAKHDRAHLELSRQLQERTATREYLVLVWGTPEKKEFEVYAPVARHPRHRKKMAVVEGGREARTGFKLLAVPGRASLLRARLGTGRTHQVRVHLSYLGYPVVGDEVYGGYRENLKRVQWKGQALHARRLTLDCPETGERLSFTAPLPREFKELMRWFRSQK